MKTGQKEFAWVTLSTNDTYALGALVLAYSLKKVNSIYPMAIMVTPNVSHAMRDCLKHVYELIEEVNIMDSNDINNLALLQRPELGITFTKFHCWHLTQYEKCVFLDADTLVLQNCDELFEYEELSAASDVSWPDCFNSGVFVYQPNSITYENILKYAIDHGSFDGGDQGILNQYFNNFNNGSSTTSSNHGQWRRLPFLYNVAAYAAYCYLPAFKKFYNQIKILHFAGKQKPWLMSSHNIPMEYKHATDFIQFWWHLFNDHVYPQLNNHMAGLAGRLTQLHLDDATCTIDESEESKQSKESVELDLMRRRQCWEAGHIDYTGADSFDNIWQHIQKTLQQQAKTNKTSTAASLI